jgi:hypothetical protein
VEDLTCHVCNALITPLGQTDGVFCTVAECPGDRLSRFDVTNVCEPHPFCLNFAGQRVEVKADASVATSPPALPAKTKRRPLPAAPRPGLFD